MAFLSVYTFSFQGFLPTEIYRRVKHLRGDIATWVTGLHEHLMTRILKDPVLTITRQENYKLCLERRVSVRTEEETENRGVCFGVGLWVVFSSSID